MSKQDKTYSRTPEDLERKYNLGQLAQGGSSQGGGDNGKISQALQEIANCKATINNMLVKIKEIESEIGEGGGSDAVYLTKAEYNALPDSKLSDNVEYRITDANTSNTFASSDIAYGGGTVTDALDSLNESLGGLTAYVDMTIKLINNWNSASFPSGFNSNNCFVSSIGVKTGDEWRYGIGTIHSELYRFLVSLSNSVSVYTASSAFENITVRIVLQKYSNT